MVLLHVALIVCCAFVAACFDFVAGFGIWILVLCALIVWLIICEWSVLITRVVCSVYVRLLLAALAVWEIIA